MPVVVYSFNFDKGLTVLNFIRYFCYLHCLVLVAFNRSNLTPDRINEKRKRKRDRNIIKLETMFIYFIYKTF